MAIAYVCHLFACKLFLFSRFGRANVFKLANADQFAETNQNSQRRQDTSPDASRRCVRRPCGLDRDTKYVLPTTQTDQNGSFASAGCIDPLEMPKEKFASQGASGHVCGLARIFPCQPHMQIAGFARNGVMQDREARLQMV
jgi:hypothetical protein